MPENTINPAPSSDKSKLLSLAASIAQLVQGKVNDDNEIVSVSGSYARQGAMIQLANSGKNILCTIELKNAKFQSNMRAQLETVLSIVPKGSPPMDRGIAIKTGDSKFDANFTARSTNTEAARRVLDDLKALDVAKQVCTPSTVVFNASKDGVRLIENVSNPSAKHFEGRLQALSMISGNTLGSRLENFVPSQPQTRAAELASHLNIPEHLVKPVLAGAVLLIVLCGGYLSYSFFSRFQEKPLVASGIPATDAALVPRADEWKISPETADADLTQWLRTHPLKTDSSVKSELRPGDFYSAYFLIEQRNPMQRVVVLGDGSMQLDTLFTGALAMAPMPKAMIANVHWNHNGTPPPDGDGIIVFRRMDNRLGATIIFYGDGRVQRGDTSDLSVIPEGQP